MAQWLFDQHGQAVLIRDDDCVRSAGGHVVGWIEYGNVYSLAGAHVGWFERGVIYDIGNRALAFEHGAEGYLPGQPAISGAPGMPGFAGRPGRPGLAGARGRPGRAGWSAEDASAYFGP